MSADDLSSRSPVVVVTGHELFQTASPTIQGLTLHTSVGPIHLLLDEAERTRLAEALGQGIKRD